MHKTLETLAGGLAAMLFSAMASAQVNPPATGGAMLQPNQPPPRQFGETTRGLMALQVSGRAAGKPLLMQEPVAQAGWDRYLKSFQNNLPQWFGERVRAGGSGGGR
jgi:hypothetical protein